MTNLKEIYKCAICGNIVEMLHTGAGELVCCGQPMDVQKENAVDAVKEKHVPVIEKVDEGVKIKISSKPHPMEEEHYIEWIEISTAKGLSKKFLKPDEAPEVLFPVKAENVSARAYCNLHGLWKNE